MTQRKNKEFELRGVNHLALVCKDMARTVDFYTNTLGMPMTLVSLGVSAERLSPQRLRG